jgi:antitoxin (DNA-binding transcriptional repressor) of toxin-antitoxin stability system
VNGGSAQAPACGNFSKAKHGWQKALTIWTNWTNVSAMKTVNVHEAKTNFSSLLATVEDSSESFVICRNGEPVADLVPHQRASRIKPHPVLGKMKIKYDPIEPATEAEWPRRFR